MSKAKEHDLNKLLIGVLTLALTLVGYLLNRELVRVDSTQAAFDTRQRSILEKLPGIEGNSWTRQEQGYYAVETQRHLSQLEKEVGACCKK